MWLDLSGGEGNDTRHDSYQTVLEKDSQILITKSVFCLEYKHGNKTKYMLTFNNMYFNMSVSGVVSFT